MGNKESALHKNVEVGNTKKKQETGSFSQKAGLTGSVKPKASRSRTPLYYLRNNDSDDSSSDSGIGSPGPDKSHLAALSPFPGVKDRSHSKALTFRAEGILGKGCYGIVYRAVCNVNGETYAIKSLVKRLPTGQQIEEITSEARVLYINGVWKNSFFPNLFACFDSPTRVFFVTEAFSRGNLQEIQADQVNGIFSPQTAKFYCAEIAAALGFLHSKNVIHRDLKHSNVMVNDNGHIVLVDLRLVALGLRSNYKCGTLEYMSPERLAGFSYDQSADWWSLGVMMCLCLLGEYPLWSPLASSETNIRNLLFVTNVEFRLSNCVGWPDPNSLSFVAGLLTKDPSLRLGNGGLDEVLGHAYLSDLNKAAVISGQLKPPYIPPKRQLLPLTSGKVSNLEDVLCESFKCPIEEPPKNSEFYYVSPDLLKGVFMKKTNF